MKDYLKGAKLTVLYNDAEFDKTQYGEKAILRTSKFFIKMLDVDKP